ncbi:beta-carotene 15,15'-monooxygenase [Lysobacteraceae bacterium NML95-0200]|nr:beta-carotene 15,15'-monooxygenase [Xanthomonadaceae bacterium NML95-0200]
MNIFNIFYVVFSLFVFAVCFWSVARIALLLKRAWGDASPIFQIPKGFPRFKSKWMSRLAYYLIINFISLFAMLMVGRGHEGHYIPLSVFIENIDFYLVVIFSINAMILGLMYAFNKIQVAWPAKLKVHWIGEVIFWVLVLLCALYFGLSLQSELEMKMMRER